MDVIGVPNAAAIAVLGDSIADGFGVKPNTNTPADHRALVGQMLTAYAQLVQRARESGIKVIGASRTGERGGPASGKRVDP